MSKKISPVVPLLFGAFILTSIVAVRGPNALVLGEKTENLANDGTEIKEVKVDDNPKVEKSKLENIVKNEGKRSEVEIKNENGKVKVKIENKIRELKFEDAKLRIKVKEATPPGEDKKKNRIENEVETETEKHVELSANDDNGIDINDEEHVVETKFPITLDQRTNTFSVTTPNGEVKVKSLPSTAINNLVENKVFSDVTDVKIEQSDDKSVDAVIKLEGKNKFNFLGIIPVTANVSAEVDPQTGDVTSLSTPWFIKSFGFLFSTIGK